MRGIWTGFAGITDLFCCESFQHLILAMILLGGLNWVFGRKQYSDFESFNRDVLENNEHQPIEVHEWQPDSVVAFGPLKVQFEIVWKEEGEDLIEFEISSETESLTLGDLLYRLNNLSFDFFKDAHHIYLEGIHVIDDSTLWLDTGS